jgi:dTDP-4-amino-4,6-dideoxygalactose transaminase
VLDSRQETANLIPRHAPPFGLHGLLSVLCQGSDASETALEKFCAEEFRVRESILLPSARSGIMLALRAVAPSVQNAVGPAYTCAVVHQAMQLSGMPVHFIDCPQGGYLMNADDRRKAAVGPSAVILCETYGIHYAPCGAAGGGDRPPLMQIWDMAMCVPQADDFLRLETGDVAVASFGLGKCLYAGWGGLLLTRNSEIAGRVRELRDQLVTRETRAIRWRRLLEVLASATAHNRLLYGFGRTVADWRNRRASQSGVLDSPSSSPGKQTEAKLSGDWIEPMVPLNRKLAMTNLAHAQEKRELRRRQAAEYYRRLEPSGLIRGFDGESLPESHFPIRVAANARKELRSYLARRGIDTATYFPFPSGLRREEYPNAAAAADEVILLPMGRCVRVDEIGMVARHVIEGLTRISN